MEAPDGRVEQRSRPASSQGPSGQRCVSTARHVSFQPAAAGHPAQTLHAAQSQGHCAFI